MGRRRRHRRRRPDYSPSKNIEKHTKKQHFPKKKPEKPAGKQHVSQKTNKNHRFFLSFWVRILPPSSSLDFLPWISIGTPQGAHKRTDQKKIGVVFGKSTLLGTQSFNSLPLCGLWTNHSFNKGCLWSFAGPAGPNKEPTRGPTICFF